MHWPTNCSLQRFCNALIPSYLFPPCHPPELLDGLLEPLAEDRLTAQEAIDIATGKAAKRRKRAASGGVVPSAVAASAPVRTMRMPDGSVVRIMGAGDAARPLLRNVKKPAGTRVVLERSPGRLDIEIPPEGLNSGSLGTGIFAVAWNAFVAVRQGNGGQLGELWGAPLLLPAWTASVDAWDCPHSGQAAEGPKPSPMPPTSISPPLPVLDLLCACKRGGAVCALLRTILVCGLPAGGPGLWRRTYQGALCRWT
jgi:hypothetical protein